MPDKTQLIREVFAELSKPGAVVLITVDGHGAPYRVRVSPRGGLLECGSHGIWQAFISSPDSWRSWEPCREPRVWEGTGHTFRMEGGGMALTVGNYSEKVPDGVVVKYRLEEVLKEEK